MTPRPAVEAAAAAPAAATSTSMGVSESSGGGKSRWSARGGGSLRAEMGASVTAALSISMAPTDGATRATTTAHALPANHTHSPIHKPQPTRKKTRGRNSNSTDLHAGSAPATPQLSPLCRCTSGELLPDQIGKNQRAAVSHRFARRAAPHRWPSVIQRTTCGTLRQPAEPATVHAQNCTPHPRQLPHSFQPLLVVDRKRHRLPRRQPPHKDTLHSRRVSPTGRTRSPSNSTTTTTSDDATHSPRQPPDLPQQTVTVPYSAHGSATRVEARNGWVVLQPPPCRALVLPTGCAWTAGRVGGG